MIITCEKVEIRPWEKDTDKRYITTVETREETPFEIRRREYWDEEKRKRAEHLEKLKEEIAKLNPPQTAIYNVLAEEFEGLDVAYLPDSTDFKIVEMARKVWEVI